MKDFDTFDKERKQVKNFDEIQKFKRKWFLTVEWPEWQKPDQWAKVSAMAHKNREQAELATGKDWAPLMFRYALDANARYEFYKTLALFKEVWSTNSRIDQTCKLGASLWHLDCNYCLISTWSDGITTCPICTRELFYCWVGD